jgi:Helix-turn-helix family
MDDAALAARQMWTLFEPVHVVSYFSAEARAAFQDAGLRGFWRGYFAGRAAPLGRAGAAPVTASFFTFAPPMVARALPAVWDLITPEDALTVRLAGAVAALRRLLGEHTAGIGAAADLLGRAADGLDCSGRVLAAANAALPVSGEEPLARLWQAATLLREHRGDGHFAALVAAGVDGCEALVLRSGQDLSREQLQPARGWTDGDWDAAAARLAARGWLDGSGRITPAGAAARQAVEDATDLAAARPWAGLGAGATGELAALLAPIAAACATVLPVPNPVGVPAPPAAAASA